MNKLESHIGDVRLLTLADRIEDRERCEHDSFNFLHYSATLVHTCKTIGCALGECPNLFPEDWEWTPCRVPKLREAKQDIPGWRDAATYFQTTEPEAWQLFIPTYNHGPGQLLTNATASEVAAHIRAFVAKRNPALAESWKTAKHTLIP